MGHACLQDPRDSSRDLSEAIFSVTDSLPFKEIGAAWQTISATSLKSEVQVVLGALPANFSFFPYAESLMTTTSSLATLGTPSNNKSAGWICAHVCLLGSPSDTTTTAAYAVPLPTLGRQTALGWS